MGCDGPGADYVKHSLGRSRRVMGVVTCVYFVTLKPYIDYSYLRKDVAKMMTIMDTLIR